VPVEAVALVLRQHDDLQISGVREVRQHEVDDPIRTAERHRRLGSIGGQRGQPPPFAAGQDDHQNMGLSHEGAR
jgi:hypothetical protein